MTEAEHLLRFAGEIVRRSRDGLDIDGGELQELLIKHGLMVEAPATAEDCAMEWAQEWGICPGDTILKLTELGKAARATADPRQRTGDR
jgi:hypothetical protein